MNFIVTAALAFTATCSGQSNSPMPDQGGRAGRSTFGARVYVIDAARSEVAWALYDSGSSSLVASFGALAGSLTIDPIDPAGTAMDFTFGIRKRTADAAASSPRLQWADLLDNGRSPSARFRSVSVVPGPENTATIVGHLSINGQTRQVAIKTTFIGARVDARQKTFKMGFDGSAIIKCSDFGLGADAGLIADSVPIRIHAGLVAPLTASLVPI
ncbi:YceI family protein [Bradyrhizobium sp.]|uniref:YceI family protein n=1 Tax=Bradyrhizobium sp. TaxID=376 RepID=UPI0039E6C76A